MAAAFRLACPQPACRLEAVLLPPGDGYDGEVVELLSAIADGRRELRATCEEAVGLTEMLERERDALAPT